MIFIGNFVTSSHISYSAVVEVDDTPNLIHVWEELEKESWYHMYASIHLFMYTYIEYGVKGCLNFSSKSERFKSLLVWERDRCCLCNLFFSLFRRLINCRYWRSRLNCRLLWLQDKIKSLNRFCNHPWGFGSRLNRRLLQIVLINLSFSIRSERT